MNRKIYLKGELGEKYAPELDMDIQRPSEIFSCLSANFDGVKEYFIEAHEKGVGFTLFVADDSIEKEEELLLPMKEGDVVVTPIPAGSSSGGGKILAAVAIASFLLFPLTGGASAYMLLTQQVGGMAAVAANMALGLAVNLALVGIQQLMAPDPVVDDNEESYLFNGSSQNIVSGDPVPVLYGQLKVPGQPISFDILDDTGTSSEQTYSYGIAGNPNLLNVGRV